MKKINLEEVRDFIEAQTLESKIYIWHKSRIRKVIVIVSNLMILGISI